MTKFEWKELVRKTKWASKKKRLTKIELNELMKNALALKNFMDNNKSNFVGADRTDPIYKIHKK